MFKRIFMLLIALLLFGAVECQAAADSKGKSKKNTSKAARQKSRRAKKNQKNKAQALAFMVRRELKKIHGMQKDLLRKSDEAETVKELQSSINSIMKKVTPHLKKIGNLPGAKFMADIDNLVKEGRKLASEPDKVSADTALELLQEEQLDLVEKFRQKVSE